MIDYPLNRRVLGQIVTDKARLHGDRTFLQFEGRTISYSELDALSNRLANGLAKLGIEKGTHVGLMIDNKPEIILLYIALSKLGAVSVAVNTAAKGELLGYYLNQSDSHFLLVDAALLERLVPLAGRLPKLREITVVSEGDEPSLRLDSIGTPQGDYRDLLMYADTPQTTEVLFSDLHALIYTSGTTGPSKGNMSTHAHALTCGFQLAESFGYHSGDVLYVCLPLFHGNAWLCSVLPALVADASVALVRRFSASRFWDEIRQSGATQFNALGAMANFIWSRPPGPADRDHRVRQVMVVPTPQFFKGFQERFGIAFTSVYALTDCGILTTRSEQDPQHQWASAGKACKDIDLRVIGDDDFELPCGETGEFAVRCDRPWLFAQGYYNMPEATAEARRNLWFHTGDRGYIDAEGYAYFVDRKKDAIRRRGENISSFEVEQIILMHSSVLDVAAYPVRSEHSEDEVMVTVVPREGATVSEVELVEHCVRNMAYFMVPRFVSIAASLPKTMTEKVEKYKLKADAEQRLAEIWDREKAGIVVSR